MIEVLAMVFMRNADRSQAHYYDRSYEFANFIEHLRPAQESYDIVVRNCPSMGITAAKPALNVSIVRSLQPGSNFIRRGLSTP
jgi:hypothetical protein